MATVTLPRMKFKDVDESSDDRVRLANDAQTTLGYGRLALAIAAPGALLFQLRKLEIEPLCPRAVAEYMKKKEHVGMYSGTKKFIWAVAGAVFFVGVFVFGMATAWEAKWSPLHYVVNTFAGLLTLFCTICVIGVGLISEQIGTGDRSVWQWTTYSLGSYDGNVPEFALSKAVQIKKAVPKVEFRIEQLLEQSDHKMRPDPDPFLVAVLGAERWYIEVWDEKEYERSL